MNTLHQIYQEQVIKLTVTERLQLARMIMDDLADSAIARSIDDSDVWTAEDLRDASRAALRYTIRSSSKELNDSEAE
jgi:hypothetical protein